ncbi:hypothetical protein IFR05_015308 [Cadophora sp. M221]|nr:hypothetical protein IFR05_015308 [Cadophora sp. M221]
MVEDDDENGDILRVLFDTDPAFGEQVGPVGQSQAPQRSDLVDGFPSWKRSDWLLSETAASPPAAEEPMAWPRYILMRLHRHQPNGVVPRHGMDTEWNKKEAPKRFATPFFTMYLSQGYFGDSLRRTSPYDALSAPDPSQSIPVHVVGRPPM